MNWLKVQSFEVLRRYSVWCKGLSSRTKSIMSWLWTSVLVGVCVLWTFRLDSFWWILGWVLIAFWLGYNRVGHTRPCSGDANCSWRERYDELRERYDKLWDHHEEPETLAFSRESAITNYRDMYHPENPLAGLDAHFAQQAKVFTDSAKYRRIVKEFEDYRSTTREILAASSDMIGFVATTIEILADDPKPIRCDKCGQELP